MLRNVALVVADEYVGEGDLDAARRYYRVAALAAEPFTFERLEALTGGLVTRRKLSLPVSSHEIHAAIDEGRSVLESTRRAGGDLFMARLWALAGNEQRALDYGRRHARGLTEAARRRMNEEIRALLAGAPPVHGQAANTKN